MGSGSMTLSIDITIWIMRDFARHNGGGTIQHPRDLQSGSLLQTTDQADFFLYWPGVTPVLSLNTL